MEQRGFEPSVPQGRVADIVRTRIVPVVFPSVVAFEPVRDFIFRTVSPITRNYRRTPLSVGAAGHVHGGDRLPWVSEATLLLSARRRGSR